MEKDDLDASASSQRRELMAATQAESDLELAFRLQMEEAMVASLALQPSASRPALPPQLPVPAGEGVCEGGREDDVSSHIRIQDLELERFQQEREDSVRSREETRRVVEELRRQAHDERFARDLLRIPEDEWADTGDWFERPIDQGFGESEEPFKLYFKGLSEPVPGSDAEHVSAVGVAICNPLGKVVLKIQKPAFGPRISREILETRALIEGLHAVHSLGIKKLHIFFDHTALFKHVSEGSLLLWTIY
uniref:Protein-L-isoaspartate O-methyltransferase 1 n=1 Tax=Anthurium amnicola TaxID=1678845 RepID=A0A1D1Z1A7_9ARAE